jgi:hypothetical protein
LVNKKRANSVQGLQRNASIAFEPLDLRCQPVETAREGRFAAIGTVRGQERRDCRLDDRRLGQLSAVREIGDLLQDFGRKV